MDATTLLTAPVPATARDAAAPLDLAALVGPRAWQRLPAAVQRRFAAAHGDTTYRGTLAMDCSRVGALFAACSSLLGGPLTAMRCAEVAATVRVHGNGAGGVVWERHLALPGREGERVVRSTKERGPHGGLVERTDGGLAMALRVDEEAGALVFTSLRYFLVVGRWRVPVPGLLTPGTCRVSHRDLGDGRFRFTLSMVHPLWGRTFHQTGVFAEATEAST